MKENFNSREEVKECFLFDVRIKLFGVRDREYSLVAKGISVKIYD